MKVTTQTPLQALNPAYRKAKVSREAIDALKRELPLLLDRLAGKVSESTLRDHLQTFLRNVAYPDSEYLVQSEVRRMDTVIHDGAKKKDPIGVIVEAKTTENRSEMFAAGKPNVKALHELVLYFMREREAGNVGIKSLVITDGDRLYVFPDGEFERLFWNKKTFRKRLLALDADKGKNNEIAYETIREHIAGLAAEEPLTCALVILGKFRTYCEDGRPDTDDRLLPLYKLLSPVHLLRRPFAGDSNHLDKKFYRELLHIIGLEEIGVDSKGKPKKNGGKKIIRRLPAGQRHPASLLENTLDVAEDNNRFRHVAGWRDYGTTDEERRFAVALELCITWVNRVLFLKLLETQLLAYHDGDPAYRFLTTERIPDYDALNSLFVKVLNKPLAERKEIVAHFSRVPYLNSSLFEISDLEDQVVLPNSLKDQHDLPLAPQSVLSTRVRAPEGLPPLEYLFTFLDAYDFGGEGRARIQEDNKRLINASVLGLIFEKINGYRDGSFYTPGFITEYMCRETIRRAVVQKFRDDTTAFADFDAEGFDDLASYLARKYKVEDRQAANRLVNSITVCDPAVGSGHFLVSALNELIATKSDLDILGANAGAEDVKVKAMVVNDELLVTYRRDGEPYEYHVSTDSNGREIVPPEVQAVQQTLFHEKRTLIENCLFGVDLNPNSVKICRLRLWIELLKSAYYDPATGRLETLPNIDINIKQGNSLISRFALDDNLSAAFKRNKYSLNDYRVAVSRYHRAGGDEKGELRTLLKEIKDNFRRGANSKDLEKYTKAKGKLEQLKGVLEMGDLFGSVNEKQVNKEIAKQEQTVQSALAEYESKRDDAIFYNAFEWRFEFPAVLDDDGTYRGFDVIVGNPPYVRQEELAEVKPYLKEHYEVFAGTADLLVYFIELSMKNLRPNGQFSFIISNKFMRAGFGKALRRFIPQYRIRELVDFGDLPVFDEATTYPLIISLEKAEPTETFVAANLDELAKLNFREHLDSVSFASLQSGLSEDGWNLADAETQRLLAKLKRNGTPLGEYVNGEIYRGVLTGFNEAFVIDEATKDRLIAEDAKSAEVIKPFLAGRDVKRYVPPVANKYILFIPWHFPLHKDSSISGVSQEAEAMFQSDYPAIYKYLTGYKNELSSRNKSETGIRYEWYALQRCAATYYEKFDSLKIVVPAIVNQPSYSLDKIGNYGNDKTSIIPIADHQMWLLGLLNSKAVDFYLQSISSAKRGGYFEYKPVYVSALPICEPPKEIGHIISNLTTQILKAKQQDPTTDTTALEAEIDVLVYRLYGLSYEEVLVVDPGFGLSAAAYGAVVV